MSYITNVLQYLDATANRLPNKLAFVDEKVSYTFSGIRDAAESIGTGLLRNDVRRKETVAVIVDRTAITLAAMFGVYEVGAIYVPIDNKMPSDRMSMILEDLRPKVILYAEKNRKLADNLKNFAPIICIEELQETVAESASLLEVRKQVLDIDPAYIIFTSGSTGKPKGIAVSHHAIIDFTEWISESCGTTEDDIFGNQSPFYFDTFIKDVFQAIKLGCTDYIMPKKLFMFPPLIVDFINERKITALFWSTSAIRIVSGSGVLEKKKPEYLRILVMGGEALQAKDINAWMNAAPKGCRFFNHYGPTEVTVDCLGYEMTRTYQDGEAIPIGKSCANMEVILLDEELRPVPKGERGEICVRGGGLALGYYGDAEKTSRAFIQNPLNPYYPDRIYRTGDIAKEDEDGNIIFLARKDDQIKHMGYRIELGEVETALNAIKGIRMAICFFDHQTDKIICCAATELEEGYIAAETKKRIPTYMSPNEWMLFKELPMNANGKIDRVALKKGYFEKIGRN